MLAVEKWAQAKNPALSYLAINHAMIAREKCEALRNIKERCIYGYKFPLPDLPSWFSMYKSRKPLFAYKRLMAKFPESTTESVTLLSVFRSLNKSPKLLAKIIKSLTPQDIEEGIKYWQSMCSNTITEIKEEIEKPPIDLEAKEKFLKSIDTDELTLGFYFLVYAPCLLYYGLTPAALYRNALNQDIPAIKNLLKIDPLIIHDPAIGYQIQSIRLYGKSNDYLDIFVAITKHPKINYKILADERKSVKSDHGAQIYVLAKALNNPLQVPQIRGLYDALARDLDGTLDDTDIKKPEGFDKTIKTKAVTWQKEYQKKEKQK